MSKKFKSKKDGIKEINKGIKEIKNAPVKSRNPFFNGEIISESKRNGAGAMKDKRTARGGSKNKQDEYLKDLEPEGLTPDDWKLIDEVPVIEEEKDDEEEHEYELL